MKSECEDSAMREKARRLAADAADDQMMTMMADKLEKFEAKCDQFVSRFDEFAKRHGIKE